MYVARRAAELTDHSGAKTEQITETQLRALAVLQSETFPKQVEPYLRLDRIAAGPGPRATYYFTYTDSKYDSVPKDVFDSARIDATALACNQYKPGLDMGITYLFIYTAANGTRKYELPLARSDC